MKIRSAGEDGHDEVEEELTCYNRDWDRARDERLRPERKRNPGRFTYVAIENEPAPKLIVDPDNVLDVRAEQHVHRHVSRVLTLIGGETAPQILERLQVYPGPRRPPSGIGRSPISLPLSSVDRQLKAALARALAARRTSETRRPTGDGDADRGRT